MSKAPTVFWICWDGMSQDKTDNKYWVTSLALEKFVLE